MKIRNTIRIFTFCLLITVIITAGLTFSDPSHYVWNFISSFIYTMCIGFTIYALIEFAFPRITAIAPAVIRPGILPLLFLIGGLVGTGMSTLILIFIFRYSFTMFDYSRLLSLNLLLAIIFGSIAVWYFTSELKQQRIKEEMNLARKIQQGLFPKANLLIPNLDITGVSLPAITVGGDYYDFIQLGPKKILTVVADVSGKGMSAALYMSKIQGMVQLAAHMYQTPREMLININRCLFDGLDRKSFITIILALFDMESEDVRICRAGHNRAIAAIDDKIQFLEGGGIGLGLERGPIFENTLEEVRIAVKSDGLFLFYTDGITEAMNEKNQQLGENAVLEILKTNRRFSAERIQQEILSTVERFRGSAEQHDDVTMVLVKVKFAEA